MWWIAPALRSRIARPVREIERGELSTPKTRRASSMKTGRSMTSPISAAGGSRGAHFGARPRRGLSRVLFEPLRCGINHRRRHDRLVWIEHHLDVAVDPTSIDLCALVAEARDPLVAARQVAPIEHEDLRRRSAGELREVDLRQRLPGLFRDREANRLVDVGLGGPVRWRREPERGVERAELAQMGLARYDRCDRDQACRFHLRRSEGGDEDAEPDAEEPHAVDAGALLQHASGKGGARDPRANASLVEVAPRRVAGAVVVEASAGMPAAANDSAK